MQTKRLEQTVRAVGLRENKRACPPIAVQLALALVAEALVGRVDILELGLCILPWVLVRVVYNG